MRGIIITEAEQAKHLAMTEAVEALAGVFGDGMFAIQNGGHFTCYEAEVVADALLAGGWTEEAMRWMQGHAEEDDEGDSHFMGTRPGDGDSDSLTGRC